jgi:hypothetical protein
MRPTSPSLAYAFVLGGPPILTLAFNGDHESGVAGPSFCFHAVHAGARG